MTLPRVNAVPAEVDPSHAAAIPPARAETVLLVEDDERVRTLACHLLRKHGYEVLEAAGGEDALRMAASHRGRIDLLLADLVMPGMSGRHLWEHLSKARPDAKVLFMSGYTDDEVVRHGVRDAGLPFLQKPFTLPALAIAVRRAIDADIFCERDSE